MKMLPVAILAGGLAQRLRPLTESVPKSLVAVNGEPFLAHQLRLLKQQGIERVVLCTGYLGEMIEAWLGNGSRFGIEVSYSRDGPQLRGTAGALAGALPMLGDNFFALYGDSYVRCDFAAAQRTFLDSGQPGLMTIFRNEERWDSSNVEFSDGKIAAYDKMNRTQNMRHIDYGLGVFRRTALECLHSGSLHDLATVYQDLLARGQLAVLEVHQRFYEIGSLSGIRELEEYVSFSKHFLTEAKAVIDALNVEAIDRMAGLLKATRDEGGRLFILGVGGSAANAGHAVNDFRKICGFEPYAPTDNVSELTARTNDGGWATVFKAWLAGSRLRAGDAILVFSVGGGNLERNISPNLVTALEYAQKVGAKILGIVGHDGGYTAKVADACVIVPTVNPARITPHAEAFQAVIWHLLVSHPDLKQMETRWESVR